MKSSILKVKETTPIKYKEEAAEPASAISKMSKYSKVKKDNNLKVLD
jgi:hypothetical protein